MTIILMGMEGCRENLRFITVFFQGDEDVNQFFSAFVGMLAEAMSKIGRVFSISNELIKARPGSMIPC